MVTGRLGSESGCRYCLRRGRGSSLRTGESVVHLTGKPERPHCGSRSGQSSGQPYTLSLIELSATIDLGQFTTNFQILREPQWSSWKPLVNPQFLRLHRYFDLAVHGTSMDRSFPISRTESPVGYGYPNQDASRLVRVSPVGSLVSSHLRRQAEESFSRPKELR